MRMAEIKIMIADDHSLLREGIRGILTSETDMNVVAEASNGTDAAESAALYNPDVILIDLDLPGSDVVETVREIRDLCPGSAIIALTGSYRRSRLMEAMRAGVNGYILKGADGRTLIQTIRGAHSMPGSGSPKNTARLLDEMDGILRAERDHLVFGAWEKSGVPDGHGINPPGRECPLTAREREVLAEMASGASNAEVAGALFISEKTVKNHATSIYRKAAVSNRRAAVRKAVSMGWISPAADDQSVSTNSTRSLSEPWTQ